MTSTLPTVRTPRIFAKDLAERVISTFALVLLSTLLAAGVGRFQWGTVLAIAGFAAFGSFLTTILIWSGAIKKIANPYVDLAYRAVVTFGQTLLGIVVAAGAISGLDFDWKGAAQTALIAAGTSALKGLTGLRTANTIGAAVFVTQPDTKIAVVTASPAPPVDPRDAVTKAYAEADARNERFRDPELPEH